jgi:hypothetical protein
MFRTIQCSRGSAWVSCAGNISNYFITDLFVYRTGNSKDPNTITKQSVQQTDRSKSHKLTNQLSFHSSFCSMMLHQTLFISTERTSDAGDWALPFSLDLFTEFVLL